jgi:hypothetical protein
MEPQLIIQDFGGAHNGNEEATRARLIKGGSWKRQRVAMIMPADTMIHSKVALSLWNLIFPPNNGVIKILAQGMEVGDAYSQAISQILAHPQLKDFEFILTVEHDNSPPPDALLKLLEDLEEHPEFCCVSGLYYTKGEGGCAQIWGDPADPVLNFRPQVPKPDSLQECVGVGMGFSLWRTSVFKDERLAKPYFKTEKGAGGVSTQDLWWWTQNRKWGYRCAVDTRVKVGHIDPSSGFIW